MDELANWYNQISNYPRLKIKEAKELYQKAINAQDILKKQYMDELILGTLYVVYDHINRNRLQLFISSSYDMDDIISAFIEVWINKLYNGELMNVDSYSFIFTSTYFNEVYKSICGDEIIVGDLFGITYECLVELITLYISYRNKELKRPFIEIVEETYFNNRYNGWSFRIHNKVVMVIPLIERIYNNLNFDKIDDLEIDKTKVFNYLRFLINLGLIVPLSDNIKTGINIENSIATNITLEQFVEDVDKAITDDRARNIIHQRFGLDDGLLETQDRIALDLGFSKSRAGQIEAKTIRKLRRNNNIRNYKGE